jgi:hypothetical protein
MESNRLSPLKSIRQHCLGCAGSCKGVRTCDTADCHLFPFRMGKNPSRQGIGVGIRNLNGRFLSKMEAERIKTGAEAAKKRGNKGAPNLINLEAPSKQISVIKKGILEITENKGKIVITLQKKQKEVRHARKSRKGPNHPGQKAADQGAAHEKKGNYLRNARKPETEKVTGCGNESAKGRD